jgi:arsenate reductase (glutaredoxin)
MAVIQIFGVKGASAARAAERFFKERRIVFQYIDLQQKAMAPREIKRFVDRFGWDVLLDSEGKHYVDAGLKYMKLSETELLAKIEREPKLLRLPLVRHGEKLAVGQDEAAWKAMLA